MTAPLMRTAPDRAAPDRAAPDRAAPDRAGPDHGAATGPSAGASSRRTPAGRVRSGCHADDGRAIIEVVFLAVLLLIPVIYIMIGVLRLQSATLAVAQAARDAGRLIETSTTGVSGDLLDAVARTDLADQRISADHLEMRVVAAGADCRRSPDAGISYRPGATYDLCVTAVVSLPGVPTVLSGSANTVTGVYTVHIGELREGR